MWENECDSCLRGVSELFSFGHKKLLNPLLKWDMLVLSAKVAVFKADYIVKLRRYVKMNAIVALVEYMKSSVLGTRSY